MSRLSLGHGSRYLLGVHIRFGRNLLAVRPNQCDADRVLGVTAHLDESRDPGAERARLVIRL